LVHKNDTPAKEAHMRIPTEFDFCKQTKQH